MNLEGIDLNGMTEGLDPKQIQALGQMKAEAQPITEPGDVLQFTRPLNEYGTIQDIVSHIHANGNNTQHIYSESLRQGGEAVMDKMETYLATKAYSSSMLKGANTTPLHLYFQLEEGWKNQIEKLKTGSCFQMGTFLHQCILEPRKFDRVVVEPEDLDIRTRDGVEGLADWWKGIIYAHCEDPEQLVREAESRTEFVHTKEGARTLQSLKVYIQNLKAVSEMESVKAQDKAIIDIVKFNYFRYGGGILPRLMKHSKREISLYGHDPVTGLPVKVRPDALQFAENIGVNAIISVKSTHAPTIQKFQYDTARLAYHLSEGFYQDVATWVTGRDFNTTITIMLQTTPPFGVACFVWEGEQIEWGKYAYKQALQTALECETKGLYPGFDAYAEGGNMGLIPMTLPTWVQRELAPMDLEV